MKLSIIAARSSNGVIGKNGTIPWRLSSDFKLFKITTLFKPIIMGRRTWDSLPAKPLTKRPNIVVTSTSIDADPEKVKIATSLADAVVIAHHWASIYTFPPEDEMFVIGGARLYEEALMIADKIYMTEVHAEVDGDVFFPEFDESLWKETFSQEYKASEMQNKDEYDFAWRTLERI